MKVFILNGSQRRENGISYKFLKIVIDYFSEKKVEVNFFHLIDYSLRWCLGCYSDNVSDCEPKRCTQGQMEDAMKSFHNLLIWSDIFVLATPVYWYSVPGIVKTFIDRLTSLENVGFLLKGKVAGLIAVGEEEGGSMVLSWLALTLNMMGFIFPPFAFVYYNKSRSFEEVEKEVEEMSHNLYLMANNLLKKQIDWM